MLHRSESQEDGPLKIVKSGNRKELSVKNTDTLPQICFLVWLPPRREMSQCAISLSWKEEVKRDYIVHKNCLNSITIMDDFKKKVLKIP